MSKTIPILGLFVVLNLLACSPIDIETAEAQVLSFRQKLSRRQYDEIYQKASKAFRQSVSRNEFKEGIEPFSSEIANPEYFKVKSWKISTEMQSGTVFVLTFESKGNTDVLFEEYIFIKERGEIRLFNYRFDTRN